MNAQKLLVSFALALCLLIVGSVPMAAPEAHAVPPAQDPPDGRVALHAAGRGNPWVNLQDGIDLPMTYVGPDTSVQAMTGERGQPLSLAAADLDGDGVPDLVSGYTGPGGGIIVLHRGNVDAIFPNSPDARKRKQAGTFTDAPFFSQTQVFALPAAPDFLGAGDLDADGHQDVVAATRGGTALYLLPGDGEGGFGPTQTIQLPGGVTALTVGEVNRRDGLADVVVGVQPFISQSRLSPLPRGEGSILVFESPEGALRGEPETFAMPAEVTAIALGQLDDHYALDLAIAAGSELLIVHGRDRKLAQSTDQRAAVPLARVDQTSFPFPIAGLAVGDFVWEEHAYHPELALLAKDGTAHILDPATNKTITYHANAPELARRITHLVPAQVSSLPTDDLVAIDPTTHQLHILTTYPITNTPGPEYATRNTQHAIHMLATLDASANPITVLPMRLNKDALDDLVILKDSPSSLTVARTAPVATLTVVSNSDDAKMVDCDPGNGVCEPGFMVGDPAVCMPTGTGCTLRVAIKEANARTGADEINFGQGALTIQPAAALPDIEDTVTIDGTTSQFMIELDGSNAGPDVNGLNIVASNSTVQGMVINRFINSGIRNGFGIALFGGDNVVRGNYLGTDATGTVALGNRNGGVACGPNTFGNTIGGTAEAARNLISGNGGYGGHGIQIGENDGGSSGNVVIGNYIGTDITGTQDLGNDMAGVLIADGSTDNTIGGTEATRRNIVSGNDGHGIVIMESSTDNLIQGNYVGTDISGTVAIPNGILLTSGGVGVQIVDSSNNTVGGSMAVACNVIAGNYSNGVEIYHSITHAGSRARVGDVTVGTPPAVFATAAQVSPSRPAVPHQASPQETVQVTGNQVLGNYIGLKENGDEALGNYGSGVVIAGASSNDVGGAWPGAGNVIAGNLGDGVVIMALGGKTATLNSVLGNKIGTDRTGTVTDPDMEPGNSDDLGNRSYGIVIRDVSDNTIGGTDEGARNIIAGNKNYGVYIWGATQSADQNRVQGNFIGTDASGFGVLGNGKAGVVVEGGSRNEIGGTETASNTIAYNGGTGVIISNTTDVRNRILGNAIFFNEGRPIDLGNDGFTLNDSLDTDAGANNLQNSPVITGFQGTVVSGTFHGAPGTIFNVEFFAYEICNRLGRPFIPGFGDGESALATWNVTTDRDGNASFVVTLPNPLPSGYTVAATATDPEGNTSEFSNSPFRLRASSPTFIPQNTFTHTILLYTVFDELQAEKLDECDMWNAELFLVINGDTGNPIQLENDAEGANDRDHADLYRDDAHHSTWFRPTQATTYTLDLYVAKAGETFADAWLTDRLLLAPNSTPNLVVLTDFRELFDEFEAAAPASPTDDENGNLVLDYYEAVERMRQYAADHQGVVVDVRQNSYWMDFQYIQNFKTRQSMGWDIDRMVSELPRSLDYVAIVGDDAVVPFYRVPVASGTKSEVTYPPSLVPRPPYSGTNPTLLDIAALPPKGQWMSDIPYGTFATTLPGRPRLDLAIGRIYRDAPLELVRLIDAFENPINLIPGQSRTFIMNGMNEASDVKFHDTVVDTLVPPVRTHYGFLRRVILRPRSIPTPYPPGARWVTGEDILAPGHNRRWDRNDIYCKVKGEADLIMLASHGDHSHIQDGVLSWFSSTYLSNEPKQSPPGASMASSNYRLVISAGCHNGLNIAHSNDDDDHWADMMSRSILSVNAAFYGTTSYDVGWNYLGDHDYYHDRLRRLFLERLFNPRYPTLGKALRAAHQDYQVWWVNAHDTRVLYTPILYSLPTQQVNVTQANTGAQSQSQSPSLQVRLMDAQAPVVSIAAAQSQTISRTVVITHFEVLTDDLGRVVFAIPHNGRLDGANYAPILPVVRHSYPLPAEAADASVTLTLSQSHPYGQPVEMAPLIPMDKSFGPLTGTYTVTNPYPETILAYQIYTNAGETHLEIVLVPLQYNPDTGEVTLYDRLNYRVAYQAPATHTIQGILVNDGDPVGVDQPDLPITVTLGIGEPFSGTMLWEVRDVGTTLLGNGYGALNLVTGTHEVDFHTDTMDWNPGPKQILVNLSTARDLTEPGATVASGQQIFTVQGNSLQVQTDASAYGPGDTATITAVVRDETGAEVAGQAGAFTQKLDGSDLALTWNESGSYTATLDLTGVITGQHLLSVTLAGGRVAETRFLVDRDPPTSTLSSPDVVYAPDAIAVTISGGNDLSGVDIYHVQYRVGESGTWTDWLTRTTGWDYSRGVPADLSPTFGPTQPVDLEVGTTYYFRVRAVDQVGNEEAEHAIADTSTTYSACVGLDGVTIAGPMHGVIGTAYVFTATVTPPTATHPIYTWDPSPMPGSLVLPAQSVVTYTWDAVGTYTITVTAENCGGSDVATHTIIIGTAREYVYLPLVMRNYTTPLAPDRYVRRGGTDSGDCSTLAAACGTIQYAVDQASDGDVIGIAGYADVYTPDNPTGSTANTYWETVQRPSPEGYNGPEQITQVVYLDKSVTLYGGYSSGFSAWDPTTYKTVLRPGLTGSEARVIFVAPGISPTLEWLHIVEGDATDQQGVYGPSQHFGGGGGIFAEGPFNGDNTAITINNCVIADNVGPYSGGGVYLQYRNNATLAGNTIQRNYAGLGGGVKVNLCDNTVLSENDIGTNTAASIGGGVYLFNSDNVSLTGNRVYSNTANATGGGIEVRGGDDIRLTSNRIYGNVAALAKTGLGGGVRLFSLDRITFQGNAVYNNVANQYPGEGEAGIGLGGGVYLEGVQEGILSGNVITGNVASLHYIGAGGGLGIYASRALQVSGNLIGDNVSSINSDSGPQSTGGGLRISYYSSEITVINNIIVRNQAPAGGGGVVLFGGSDKPVAATLLHNTIVDNGVPAGLAWQVPAPIAESEPFHDLAGVVPDGSGFAEVQMLADSVASPQYRSDAVVLAEAQGILVGPYSTLSGINNLVSGHTLGISVTNPVSSVVTLDYTLWHGNITNYSVGVTDTNPRTGDPAFVNPTAGDYHVGSASAAIDQGVNAGVSTDIDGDIRPQGAGYDIGADEYTGVSASSMRGRRLARLAQSCRGEKCIN